MRILELVIKSPNGETIREIPFNDVGISFVYGDIRAPENEQETINSVGKTLLLKMIDYVFGADEDKEIMKPVIAGYRLLAKVKYNDRAYNVHRVIGDSSQIHVNGDAFNLEGYKGFFGIERRLCDKQILLAKKNGLVSPRQWPSGSDIQDFLRLLNLVDLMELVDDIYQIQDEIKLLKGNRKELASMLGELNLKKISERIFLVDKQVEKQTMQLGLVSEKVKNMELADMKKETIEEYSTKSRRLKKAKASIERQKRELERLQEYLHDSDTVNLASAQIIAMYEKANHEVPDLIKQRLEAVQEFHRTVFEERKEFLQHRREELHSSISAIEEEVSVLSVETDRLGKIIAQNEAYQESIALYNEYNAQLQELKYEQGQLVQIKNVEKRIEEQDALLSSQFEAARETHFAYSGEIKKYKDFIYNIIRLIYGDDFEAYFEMAIRPKHQTTRPLDISLNITGDTGEGVTEVKKNIVDYMVFRFNKLMRVFIQDSSCYNGIDPRQVGNMLRELAQIASSNDKQCIVAINQYQLGDYESSVNFVEKYSSIVLSEEDKLLKFDF